MVRECSEVESETSASNLLGGLEPGLLHLRTLELVYRVCSMVPRGHRCRGSLHSRCMVWNSHRVSGELHEH